MRSARVMNIDRHPRFQSAEERPRPGMFMSWSEFGVVVAGLVIGWLIVGGIFYEVLCLGNWALRQMGVALAPMKNIF